MFDACHLLVLQFGQINNSNVNASSNVTAALILLSAIKLLTVMVRSLTN